MAASKRFYVDRGLAVAKSFGRKYVEFDMPSGAVTLGLYGRRALAKDAGVAQDGSGSHRLVIGGDAGPFTDPDGFEWETAPIESAVRKALRRRSTRGPACGCSTPAAASGWKPRGWPSYEIVHPLTRRARGAYGSRTRRMTIATSSLNGAAACSRAASTSALASCDGAPPCAVSASP